MIQRAYLELTKPRLVLLALLACVSSFFMASQNRPDYLRLMHTLIGASFLGGGANALNQFMEKDLDSKMKRTQNRPIPSRRLHETQALIFGLASSLGGIFYLGHFVNRLTGLVGLAILSLYLFVYTPLKRKTPLNTYVGAIPGALPVLLGWGAVNPAFGREVCVLFTILFVWQLPHFLAIAWVYREDYMQGGFKMLTGFDANGTRTARQIVLYSFLLLILSLLPTFVGFAGLTYLFMAIFFGVNLCGFALYLASHRLSHARHFIYASIIYLFALNISMLVDKV